MKSKLFILGLILSFGIAVTSCKDEDDDSTTVEKGNEIITENITTDQTWTSDKVYQLGGRITVEDGATLTIEPGTIIKGEQGQAPLHSWLPGAVN